MPITTLSSREFNQSVSEAKKLANNGPVFITDRGKTAHVLINFQEYQRLTKQKRSIVEALSMPDGADIDFDAPKLKIESKSVDLT